MAICKLSVPFCVHKPFTLQACVEHSSRFAWRKVSDEREFVENAPAKIICNHGEAVRGALELQAAKMRALLNIHNP